QRTALPAACIFRRPALRMNTPHARLALGGHQGERIAHVNPACESSPRDDGSVTGQCEYAVHRQAEQAVGSSSVGPDRAAPVSFFLGCITQVLAQLPRSRIVG